MEKLPIILNVCILKLAKSFLPAMMEKNHGHMVVIASAAGLYPIPRISHYGASKAAAIHFNSALRNEMWRAKKSGIKFTSVCPFFLNTKMSTLKDEING